MAGMHIPFDSTATQVLMLARVHGDPVFWHQVIAWDTEAINLRRALLFMIFGRGSEVVGNSRSLLGHGDSRLRALACTALGQEIDRGSTEQLELLESDSSLRVRVAAKRALRAIGGSSSLRGCSLAEPRRVMRVIVSEDSPRMGHAYRQLMEALGCRVEVASTDIETIDQARQRRPALVVTDNQKRRDNSNGLRMTEHLAGDPALSEVVVVMVSADPVEGPFLWNGGDHFIRKTPLAMHQLMRLVQEYTASLT